MREPNAERRTRPIQGVCVQTTNEDLERLKKRCDESDERLIMGTRRVRTRTWNGIPADDPDLEPRFPSEKTISACKKDLDLGNDRKKYIFVRDTFQRMCTEAGIIKKSHNPKAWERVKLALVDAVPFLNRAYSQPSRPKKGDPMWFALDIICSDVAKKIRVLNTKLDIKQVKQNLQLDPHRVTVFRRSFVEILRDANFKSRFDIPIDVWDRLKRTLHSGSPHLQAVLPIEIWDHKDDRRVKSLEYLCRDVTKRYKDRRGNLRKAVDHNEVIKAELNSPADESQRLSVPEPKTPVNEIQGPPLSEPNSLIPIAPELLVPRSYNGDLVDRKPVLRYTAEGLATVVLEPESSRGGIWHEDRRVSGDSQKSGENYKRRIIPANSQNESYTHDHEAVQNRDDSFSRSVINPMHSDVENNYLGIPIINEHADIMQRFGPPSEVPIKQNNDLDALAANDHDDYMRRFGPIPIASMENDHLERRILEDHAKFSHQFGYETPPNFSFMENDLPNRSFTQFHDDCFRWRELDNSSVVPIMGKAFPKNSVIENHDDYFNRTKLETHSMLPKLKIGFPNMSTLKQHSDHLRLITEDHHEHFGTNSVFSQSELPKVEPDPSHVPINEDHGDFFPEFVSQLECVPPPDFVSPPEFVPRSEFVPSSEFVPQSEFIPQPQFVHQPEFVPSSEFIPQPELSNVGNDDFNMQIMQSVEVDSPLGVNFEGIYVDDDPFYMGPSDYGVDHGIDHGVDYGSDYGIDEGSIYEDAENFQEYEYPDPEEYEL